jgi:hypothetical protein
MKKHLTVAVALLFASSLAAFAAPDTAALEANENAAWQAFKDKKPDEFKKIVDKDMISVSADGIADMNKEIASMQSWDMKSFKISGFKAFSDEKDVAVTSYTVAVEGTYDGKDASGTYNGGSVWKMEDGQWLAIFHTDVKQESATNP